MLFGLSRTAATEFSFFLAIPTLFAATGYEVLKNRHLLVAPDLPAFGVGFVAAFVSAFLCVRWLIRYVSHHDFIPFVWYRIAFGGVILATAYTGIVRVGLTSRGRWIGPLFAVLGVFGFSVKAILIKLAYAWYPVDALTLLTLRMLFSAPFFIAMAWWSSRPPHARPLARADWTSLCRLGFIGYYLASLLDFMGLAYITAALERLVLFLYPTMVVVLSALVLRKPITRRVALALLLSYAGIAIVFVRDLAAIGRTRRGAVDRRRAGVRERGPVRAVPRQRRRRDRAHGQHALHSPGDARVHGVRRAAVRRDARSRRAARAGVASTRFRWRWPWCRRCCRHG